MPPLTGLIMLHILQCYKDATPNGVNNVACRGCANGCDGWRPMSGLRGVISALRVNLSVWQRSGACTAQCGITPVGARHAAGVHLKYIPSLLGWARLYCPFGAVVCTRLACQSYLRRYAALCGIAPSWLIKTIPIVGATLVVTLI